MNIEFEESDLIKIAEMVAEKLKPMLSVPSIGTADNKPNYTVMDIPKLCEYLSVSERWVRAQVAKKEIPHFKAGGLLRFQQKAIDVYMRNNRCN